MKSNPPGRTQSYFSPTVTHRVRSFLKAQDGGLRPWSSLDETYASLYKLMRARKNDPLFWTPLRDLLGEIVATASDAGSPHRLSRLGVELLSSWDLDDLVRDLKQAIPGESDKIPSLGGFVAGLPTALLGGFLVFGATAAGCHQVAGISNPDAGQDSDSAGDTETETSLDTESETGTGDGPDTDAPDTDAPWYQDCNLEPDSVIWNAVDASALSFWEKYTLCQCIDDLNASWNAGLTSLFENGSDGEIADYLYSLLNCCYQESSQLDTNFEEVVGDFVAGQLCEGTVIYMAAKVSSGD